MEPNERDGNGDLVPLAAMDAARRDRLPGEIIAAMDRDAAAEARLVSIAPHLSDEQILYAWEALNRTDAVRWRARGALVHEALRVSSQKVGGSHDAP